MDSLIISYLNHLQEEFFNYWKLFLFQLHWISRPKISFSGLYEMAFILRLTRTEFDSVELIFHTDI